MSIARAYQQPSYLFSLCPPPLLVIHPLHDLNFASFLYAEMPLSSSLEKCGHAGQTLMFVLCFLHCVSCGDCDIRKPKPWDGHYNNAVVVACRERSASDRPHSPTYGHAVGTDLCDPTERQAKWLPSDIASQRPLLGRDRSRMLSFSQTAAPAPPSSGENPKAVGPGPQSSCKRWSSTSTIPPLQATCACCSRRQEPGS